MNKYDIWDKYFADTICDWDIWKDWTKDYITERLDEENVEYTDEDVEYLYESAIDYQNDIRSDEIEEAKNTLYSYLDYAIEESESSAHLSPDDIGKVLTKLAVSYFG